MPVTTRLTKNTSPIRHRGKDCVTLEDYGLISDVKADPEESVTVWTKRLPKPASVGILFKPNVKTTYTIIIKEESTQDRRDRVTVEANQHGNYCVEFPQTNKLFSVEINIASTTIASTRVIS